VYENTLIDIYE